MIFPVRDMSEYSPSDLEECSTELASMIYESSLITGTCTPDYQSENLAEHVNGFRRGLVLATATIMTLMARSHARTKANEAIARLN